MRPASLNKIFFLGGGVRATHHDDGLDGALLDGRGLLEAVSIDAAEQVLVQAYLFEGREHRHLLRLGEVRARRLITICGVEQRTNV